MELGGVFLVILHQKSLPTLFNILNLNMSVSNTIVNSALKFVLLRKPFNYTLPVIINRPTFEINIIMRTCFSFVLSSSNKIILKLI